MWGRLATCGRLAIGLPLPAENLQAQRLSFAACRYVATAFCRDQPSFLATQVVMQR